MKKEQKFDDIFLRYVASQKIFFFLSACQKQARDIFFIINIKQRIHFFS